jgi:hypothetical protein
MRTTGIYNVLFNIINKDHEVKENIGKCLLIFRKKACTSIFMNEILKTDRFIHRFKNLILTRERQI